MATLKLTFLDVYTKVAEYLGIVTPTGTDLTKVKGLTLRGYRKFLFPLDLSTGKVHHWKFLEKTTTMSVSATGGDTYDMPIGFSSFVAPFTCTTPVSWNPIQKSLAYIQEQKSQTTSSGYPRYFALQTGDYDEITGQKYKVVFWPTPSNSLDYYYSYVFTPPAPVEESHVFIGDDLCSEAILECALAAAELSKHDEPRGHSQEADRLVQTLIAKDKSDSLVPNLGQMTDGKIEEFTRSALVYLDSEQILPE